MRITIDIPGGDGGTAPNLEGAAKALKYFDHELILVGNETELRDEMDRLGYPSDKRLRYVHAETVIDMEAEEPVQECRKKPDSSIMICAELVARGEADALVSAGNSGAVMTASFLKTGRLSGIARPAIAAPIPTTKGMCVLIDAGANSENKPQHLLEFALMGTVYAKHILHIKNPSVGVLSVGEEENKGNALTKNAIALIKRSGLNFYGPIEGRDIPFGKTDVIVCDGFVGNIALKLCEGIAEALFGMIKREINKRPISKIGALMAKPAFRAIKKKTNPDSIGGAPLLGINGVTVICHGNSNALAICSAIQLAGELVESRTNDVIRENLCRIKDVLKASNYAEDREEKFKNEYEKA